jgi:hypothetical protein
MQQVRMQRSSSKHVRVQAKFVHVLFVSCVIGVDVTCVCLSLCHTASETQATELNHGTLCPAAADAKAADAKACGLLPLLSARVT